MVKRYYRNNGVLICPKHACFFICCLLKGLSMKIRTHTFATWLTSSTRNGCMMIWISHVVGDMLEILHVNVHEGSIMNVPKNVWQRKNRKRGVTEKEEYLKKDNHRLLKKMCWYDSLIFSFVFRTMFSVNLNSFRWKKASTFLPGNFTNYVHYKNTHTPQHKKNSLEKLSVIGKDNSLWRREIVIVRNMKNDLWNFLFSQSVRCSKYHFWENDFKSVKRSIQ